MDTLNHLIDNFSVDTLKQLFRQKISSFKPDDENYEYLFEDNENITDKYSHISKIGEADLSNSDDLLILTAKTSETLTKRTGKKRQYEIAKKVLKEESKDAAFFVFYDANGQFRFSFIRTNFLGAKRDFTDFKRYTYFVSPEFSNNTFKKQFESCDCSNLESILNAFSVEPLNKLFYNQIAESFYGLIGGKVGTDKKAKDYISVLKLPSMDSITHRRIYQEFAVRFIGRTIFIWFLKNKTSDNNLPLIPADWVTSKKVKETSNYYHAILEKLFFEILNKPLNERVEELPTGQEIIPFLNDGLFEPHSDDYYKAGFGGFSQHNNTLLIPDEWILKLFETLEQFNFTIDENSLNDQEVSIDPEMLGTIFENLLAEIDPDTEKSARKSTGSFYTPREIVDYMVEESLVSYLKTKTNTVEDKLHELFKENDLAEDYFENKKQLIDAFNDIKILDPACGSGAFPMGALQKINIALQKLDPDAKIWKAKQLAKVDNAIYRQTLREKLDKSNVEYIRKLGVIQHSIYGVDIQPIATEISKLRSFLSLVVDENIDDKAENRGIYPLPNLEFKFVTANTLIGLEKDKSQVALDFGNTNTDIEELENIRNNYLQAFGLEKEKLKQQFLVLQKQIARKEFNQSGTINKKAQQVIGWNPFSHDKSDWFDPQWMFGVDGFDVVIGNPPYITYKGKERVDISQSEIKNLISLYPNSAEYKINSYALFTEQGVNILKKNGTLCYIIPSTILQNVYLKKIRKYLINEYHISQIVSFEHKIFQAVTDSIIIVVNNKHSNSLETVTIRKSNLDFAKKDEIKRYKQAEWINHANDFVINIKSNLDDNIILDKMEFRSEFIEDYLKVYVGIVANGIKKFLSDYKVNASYKKYLQGKHINNFSVSFNELYINFVKEELHSNTDENVFLQDEKILVRKTGNRLIAALDSEQFYTDQSIYNLYPRSDKSVKLKIITALLNSNVLQYYFNKKMITNADIFPYIKGIHLKKLPVKFPSNLNEKLFETLVDEITKGKKEKSSTTHLELKLNIIIYKLYDLIYSEVKIIDPEFEMSKEDYESHE